MKSLLLITSSRYGKVGSKKQNLRYIFSPSFEVCNSTLPIPIVFASVKSFSRIIDEIRHNFIFDLSIILIPKHFFDGMVNFIKIFHNRDQFNIIHYFGGKPKTTENVEIHLVIFCFDRIVLSKL